ncbi:MAG: S8 family serine peptidase, partial [Chloroflexota bacterium]
MKPSIRAGLAARAAFFTLITVLIAVQFAPSAAQDTTPLPGVNLSPSTQQPQALLGSTGQFFYYYEGQRIPLQVAPEVVAVRFSSGDTNQQNAALSQLSTPLRLAQSTQHRNPDYTLVQVNSQMSPQGAVDLVSQLRQSKTQVQWANPVFRVPGGLAVLTDEFIGRFPAAWTYEQIQAFNAQNGVEVLSPLLSNDNSYVLRVTNNVVQAGVDALTMANRYYESGQVVYAEPNFSNLIEQFFTPNDSFFSSQWPLNNTGQTVNGVAAGTADADIDAVEAWNITTGSSTITIAIIDDAYDSTHVDLGTGTSKQVPGYDSFSNTGGVFPVPGATEGHGTATAGLAAATGNNGQGISGVCSGCRIMPIRTFDANGGGTNAQFANGINYAWQNGADILSNSWGGGSPSTSITNAINAALTSGRGGKGEVVVFSSGNTDLAPVAYPASLTQVISVSASNLCDQRKTPTLNACNYFEDWWGPNSGPENDISAPGVGLVTTDMMGTNGYVNGNYVANFNGTSGAAPIVSGIAGLMLSINPYLTAAQVQQILKTTANDINTAGFDNATGFGRVNANNAVLAAQAAGIPANDLIANATVITLPSVTTQDPLGSTTSGSDPTTCGSGVNTVWFRYVATATKPVTFTTRDSSYDTILSVYTSGGTMVGCDDDGGPLVRSSVGVNVVSGTTYNVMVAKFGATPLSAPATLKLSLLDTPTGDTLALYNPAQGFTSLIDILQDMPPAGDYNTFTSNAPVVGTGWVMGDWNGDGQKTPGL